MTFTAASEYSTYDALRTICHERDFEDDAYHAMMAAYHAWQRAEDKASLAATEPQSTASLQDYQTGDIIRPATQEELEASISAAQEDGGAGVIIIDGRSCFVS